MKPTLTEYEETRHALFKTLYEELPSELSEELAREMEKVRRRMRAEHNESEPDSFVETVIRSGIVTREVDRQLPPPPPDPSWLAHNRVAELLAKNGAKILNSGNKGYPDLLFEIRGEVFAAEVKATGDCLKPHQEMVIGALKRLKRIFVVRESGKKAHPEELSLEELLSELQK
jgi:hypothetical protein